MQVEMTGIIISETDLSESDKLIKILTCEKGIISAIARRSKVYRNRQGGMLQLFAYCKFTLYLGKKGYIVNNSEIKELFFELRSNLKSLSLAQYFCQLCIALKPDEEASEEFLRIFLNSLFYLSKQKMSVALIKSIFEIRACSLCGYMPCLESCAKCGTYEGDSMYFLVESGKLFCGGCISKEKAKISFLLSSPLLYCLRYILYSPIAKLFKFSVSASMAERLSFLTEKYVMLHVSDSFKSLEFYKSIPED